MLSDRIATYSGVNKVLTGNIQRRQKRQMQEEMRQDEQQCDHVVNVQANIDSPTISDEDDDIDEASTVEPKRKHRRTVKEGISVFMPHDILKSAKLVSCTVRNNISPTQLSAIMYSLVPECGGDTPKLGLIAGTAN